MPVSAGGHRNRTHPLESFNEVGARRSGFSKHTGANAHDSQMAMVLVDTVEAIARSRGRPRRRLDAVPDDRTYHAETKTRQPLRDRGIRLLIARHNTEHGSGPNVCRWVVEAAPACLFQYRRLRVLYEQRDDIHEAFLGIGWNRVNS